VTLEKQARQLLTRADWRVVKCSKTALAENPVDVVADDDDGDEDGGQFLLPCDAVINHQTHRLKSLVDSGATNEFLSRKTAKRLKVDVIELQNPVRLEVADGERGLITHGAEVDLVHGSHRSKAFCYITDIPGVDVILGMNWLRLHDPSPRFRDATLRFDSSYCIMSCLAHSEPCTVSRKSKPQRRHVPEGDNIRKITAKAALRFAARKGYELCWVYPHQFEKADRDEEMMNETLREAEELFKIYAGSLKQEDYDKFYAKLHKEPMLVEEIKQKVPKKYHEWIHMWNPREANVLPPHRDGVDHVIETDRTGIPKRKTYGLSRAETQAVKAYVDDMVAKGFIRPSTSPYAAPVLVVKKPGGGLRVCVDYRELNARTIKNRNVPPLVQETMARLSKARIMTVLDVIAAFTMIRIREEDVHKTAFLTRFGLFEYRVMPFGLTNAPATFQSYINNALRDLLDICCTAYVDDILIYSEKEEDHDHHVIQVLERLNKAGLYLDVNKCKFGATKVKYLGLIISTNGIEMDPEKVQAVMDWQPPTSVKDILSFVGFVNFYRRFIAGFSSVVKPLLGVVRSGTKAIFPLLPDSKAMRAFESLKRRVATRPVLAHFDPDLPTWIETDASDYVVAAVLSQMHDGVLRPVAFLSQKMSPAECNYDIYDKELLAIVRAFEEWKPELSGTADPIKILSDHQNLQHFMTAKRLNRRQARWAEFLSEFNFKITYRPGKLGSKPDALTRRPGDLPTDANDERHQHQVQVLLPRDRFEHPRTIELVSEDASTRAAVHYAKLCVDEWTETVLSLAAMATALYEIHCDTKGARLFAMTRAQARQRDESSPQGKGRNRAENRRYADGSTHTELETSLESRKGDFELTDDDGVSVRSRGAFESAPADDATGNTELGGDFKPYADETTSLTDDDLFGAIRAAYTKDGDLEEIMMAKRKGRRRIPWHLIDTKKYRIELKDCEIIDGLLYVKGKLYVPDVADLRTKVVEHIHNSMAAGHAGKHGTYYKIHLSYYWPFMTEDIARYVRSCHICKRSKAFRDGKHGLLHPLAIPQHYWRSISIDFITPLPICERHGKPYQHIMVVVDRLSKSKKFIPLYSLKVEDVVQAYIEHVWRCEGHPEEIISDRGTQFTSLFWNRLCKQLGVKPKLSTAFHPETDGQTENANAYLKQYLRAFATFDQDNWVDLLPLAEFEANSTPSSTTKMPPFMATKGYMPRAGFEPPSKEVLLNQPLPQKQDNAKVDNLIQRLHDLRVYLRENIAWAQAKQKEYTDRKRLPSPEIREGDSVWLDTRNLKTLRPNASLDYKNRGPFRVRRVCNNSAYELELPED
jgi:hypothetical protein